MLIGNSLSVYNLFLKHKKLSDIDIVRLSKVNPNSIRSSRLRLERIGLIKRTGKKKKHTIGGHGQSLHTVYELVRVVDTSRFFKKKTKVSVTKMIRELRQIKKKIESIIKRL